MEIRRNTSELLMKILDLWKIEEPSLEDEVSRREAGADRG
jgi:hypothetical protein